MESLKGVTKCQALACLLCQTSSIAQAEEGLPTSRNSEGVRLLAPCVHTDEGEGKMSGLKEHGVQNLSLSVSP